MNGNGAIPSPLGEGQKLDSLSYAANINGNDASPSLTGEGQKLDSLRFGANMNAWAYFSTTGCGQWGNRSGLVKLCCK